jgi:hypothetical protein
MLNFYWKIWVCFVLGLLVLDLKISFFLLIFGTGSNVLAYFLLCRRIDSPGVALGYWLSLSIGARPICRRVFLALGLAVWSPRETEAPPLVSCFSQRKRAAGLLLVFLVFLRSAPPGPFLFSRAVFPLSCRSSAPSGADFSR